MPDSLPVPPGGERPREWVVRVCKHGLVAHFVSGQTQHSWQLRDVVCDDDASHVEFVRVVEVGGPDRLAGAIEADMGWLRDDLADALWPVVGAEGVQANVRAAEAAGVVLDRLRAFLASGDENDGV